MRGVTARRNGVTVLEDINLHLHCGELTAVIGENGAGKTTLVKCLLGEMPHAGEVHFLDAARRRKDSPVIGYVPQHNSFDKEAPVSVLDLFAASLSARPACLGVSASVRQAALDGFTALMTASQDGHTECVRALLEARHQRSPRQKESRCGDSDVLQTGRRDHRA